MILHSEYPHTTQVSSGVLLLRLIILSVVLYSKNCANGKILTSHMGIVCTHEPHETLVHAQHRQQLRLTTLKPCHFSVSDALVRAQSPPGVFQAFLFLTRSYLALGPQMVPAQMRWVVR
jgi:hypothetical protein